MAGITVIGGSASQDLARKISGRLGAPYVGAEERVFPDGESKVTLSSKPKGGSKVVVVQSTFPPVDTNLIRAFSLIHKARQFSSNIVAVIPYMGYARQDREFLPGEVVTMEVIAKLFETAGASKLVVVDIHSAAGLGKFGIPAKNVSAVPELVRHFEGMRLRDPLVVSPDLGGTERAGEFARLFKADHISLNKQRDRRTGRVRIKNPVLHGLGGRDLIVVDDMISTGGSVVKAAKFLRRHGCRRVFVACTHALLVGDAKKKIRGAGVARIVSTNTVSGDTGKVDVSGIIAEAVA